MCLGRPVSRPSILARDRIEIDEPRLEQRAGHRLQRLVHAAVEFNLVVQCSEDLRYGTLLGEGREEGNETA